jgi:formylglycine-generating enzyme required for sulfatase activity
MDIKLIPGEYKVSIEDSNNKYCASRITVKADEILDIICEDTSVKAPAGMVYVPKGYYTAGNDSYENGVDKDEFPKHTVVLTYDYFMDEHEVTNKAYCEFLNDINIRSDGNISNKAHLVDINSSGNKLYSVNGLFYVREGYDEYPVVNVTWMGAIYYANWQSEKHGLSPAYDDDGLVKGNPASLKNVYGFRLPTEYEWEFAAFSSGKDNYLYSGGNDIDRVAIYAKNANKQIDHVMSKQPNTIGLYDMSGNVAEFCYDVYKPFPEKEVSDYFVSSSDKNANRIIKGGDYKSQAFDCRIKDRDFISQQHSSKTIGFRLVMTKK